MALLSNPKFGGQFHGEDYPHMDFDDLSLRCYSPEEIHKLSVLQVTQAKTFDEVNYPIKGGLYDPSLGPIEMFDHCETCTLNALHCPGHMGHIRLEVPAFNPLLFNFTYSVRNERIVSSSNENFSF